MRFLNKAAAALVVAVCFYATLTLLEQSFNTYRAYRINGDPVSTLEMRVLRSHQFIPDITNNSDIGYLAELGYTEARAREFRLLDVEHIGRYYITQYVLTPMRVFPSSAYPLVIAHFLKDTDSATRAHRAQEAGLSLLVDIGDGVALYKRDIRK